MNICEKCSVLTKPEDVFGLENGTKDKADIFANLLGEFNPFAGEIDGNVYGSRESVKKKEIREIDGQKQR